MSGILYLFTNDKWIQPDIADLFAFVCCKKSVGGHQHSVNTGIPVKQFRAKKKIKIP